MTDVLFLCLACLPGKVSSILCIWWNNPGKRVILMPKHWPAMVFCGKHGPINESVHQEMSLRFVTGRPVRDITTQFLEWCCTHSQKQGKTAWLLIWDNASWHNSKRVRSWLREHNNRVKKEKEGVRILPLFLPKQSPWLNPIEPKWVHSKRNVVETNGLLTAKQLAERVCAYYGTPYESHLVIPEKVA